MNETRKNNVRLWLWFHWKDERKVTEIEIARLSKCQSIAKFASLSRPVLSIIIYSDLPPDTIYWDVWDIGERERKKRGRGQKGE